MGRAYAHKDHLEELITSTYALKGGHKGQYREAYGSALIAVR